MPPHRRRSSATDMLNEQDYCLRCQKVFMGFWTNKFWRNAKLCASFIIVLDTVTIMCKWAYLQTRPAAFRLAIHVAEKILYPYWFASIISNGLYIWYGIMDEYTWAMKMYVFNNIIHVSFLDLLLFVELIVVLKFGHEPPWTHLTVGMTILKMVLITIWHPIVIYVAWAFERGINRKQAGFERWEELASMRWRNRVQKGVASFEEALDEHLDYKRHIRKTRPKSSHAYTYDGQSQLYGTQ